MNIPKWRLYIYSEPQITPIKSRLLWTIDQLEICNGIPISQNKFCLHVPRTFEKTAEKTRCFNKCATIAVYSQLIKADYVHLRSVKFLYFPFLCNLIKYMQLARGNEKKITIYIKLHCKT